MSLSNHQHFKASVSMLCLAFTVLITRAMPCRNGQHCRNCDKDGDCSTQCERGYFGRKCRSECSSRCKIRLCELTARGIETCTEGCVPGFMGTSCNIPCSNPGTQCTECEGGCDGGYCRLSPTSCVSGCVDSYYGLDCKNCSERCKSCNRSTGICDRCRDPYRGLNCEKTCENCAGSCESGCEGGCQPGFYGHWCDKVCSENCRPGPDTDAVSILECDRNVSINCITECNKTTGDCVVGCNAGWYGKNCSSRCNPECSYMTCAEPGACVDGCAPGYAGTDCSCYENCIDVDCHSENGTCVKGCNSGYYGAFCNNTCEICVDGVCDRKFGFCTKGCNITHQTCKSTCRHDCPIETCLEDRTCSERTPGDTLIIGTSTARVLCLAAILVAICIAYGRHCAKRTNQADHYLEAYQPASMYWEIADEDVNLEGQHRDNQANDEQLREVQDRDTDHDAASDGASEDSLSYSHHVRDIPSDDETTVYHKYIPPAEDITTNN